MCKIITFLCRQKENALIKKLAKEEKRPVTLFDLEENRFNSRFRANRHRTLYIQNNRNNFKSYLNTYRYINRTIEEGKKNDKRNNKIAYRNSCNSHSNMDNTSSCACVLIQIRIEKHRDAISMNDKKTCSFGQTLTWF